MNLLSFDGISRIYDKFKLFLFFGIVFVISAILLIFYSQITPPQEEEIAFDLYLMLGSSKPTRTYLEVTSEPLAFAFFEQNKNEFYFVLDAEGNYSVARLTSQTVQNLQNASTENPVRITGLTTETPDSIKELGIAAWNDVLSEDQKLTLESYDRYFSPFYIDEEGHLSDGREWIFLFAIGLGGIGGFSFLWGLIHLFSLRRKIKNFKFQKELFAELKQKDTISLKEDFLFLTKHYLLSTFKHFDCFSWDEIVWVNQRHVDPEYYLEILTLDGKMHEILIHSLENSELVLKRICKNSKVLVGDTKENRIKIQKQLQIDLDDLFKV